MHFQSCGHTVHVACLKAYLDTMSYDDAHQQHLVDHSSGEFVCPVCRRISNGALPLVARWGLTAAGAGSASLEFLWTVCRRKGLPISEMERPRTLALGVVNDCITMAEAASRHAEDSLGPGSLEFGGDAQEEFLRCVLRAMDCLCVPDSDDSHSDADRDMEAAAAATVSASSSSFGSAPAPDYRSELLGQFLQQYAAALPTLRGSVHGFRAVCQRFYLAAMVQASLTVLYATEVHDVLAEQLRTSTWYSTVMTQGGQQHSEKESCAADTASAASGMHVEEAGCGADGDSDREGYTCSQLEAVLAQLCMPVLRQLALFGKLRYKQQDHGVSSAASVEGEGSHVEGCSGLLQALRLPSIRAVLTLKESGATGELVPVIAECCRQWYALGADVAVALHDASRLGSTMAALPSALLTPYEPFSLIALPEQYVTLLLKYQDCPCSQVNLTALSSVVPLFV